MMRDDTGPEQPTCHPSCSGWRTYTDPEREPGHRSWIARCDGSCMSHTDTNIATVATVATYESEMDRLIKSASVEQQTVYVVRCPLCDELMNTGDGHDYTVYDSPGDACDVLSDHLDGSHWDVAKGAFV